jgi:hypothetical protein
VIRHAPFASHDEFKTTATNVLRRLHDLQDRAEAVRHWSPFGSFRTLAAIAREMKDLRNEYYRCFEESYVKLSVTADGDIMAGIVMQQNLHRTLPIFLRLQGLWSNVNAVIDYQRAYAFAVLSLYISIFASVLGLVLGFLPFLH